MRRRAFLVGMVGSGLVAAVGGCSSPGGDDDAVGPGTPQRLLVVGDSITNGSAAPSFPVSYGPLTLGMLGELAARPDSFVGGYPGAASPVIVEKVREFRAQRPDLVVVLAGLNDAPQGVPLDVTKANLQQIVQEVGPERCVVGVPPVPRMATPAEMQALVDLQSWLVRERGLPEPVVVVDFQSALRGPDSVAIDPRFADVDGVHPNGLGHQVMARTLVATLRGARPRLKAPGLVQRVEYGNRFRDPLNAAVQTSDVWRVVDPGPSILQGARYVPGSPDSLSAGRWLELDCATGPEAGVVTLASVPCDVADARGRRVVLCGQCEVEVVSGAWLEDVSADASGVVLGLLDGAGQVVPESTPFQGNAGYVSETDPRVVRWGPVVHPVALDPATTSVSVSVTCRLAPNSRVRVRLGGIGLSFDDELPYSFRTAPSVYVEKLP